MGSMPTKALEAPSCPRCAALMTETERVPHPLYSNLINVRYRCAAGGFATALAVAPIEDR